MILFSVWTPAVWLKNSWFFFLLFVDRCVSGQKSLFVFYSLSLNFVFFEYSDRGVDHLHFVNLNIIIQLLLFRFSLSISLEITFQIPIFYLSFLFSPNNHFAKKKIAYYFRIHRKYPFLHWSVKVSNWTTNHEYGQAANRQSQTPSRKDVAEMKRRTSLHCRNQHQNVSFEKLHLIVVSKQRTRVP